MGRVSAELPDELPHAFRVSDAPAYGLARGRLYRAGMERPHHGVRVRPSAGGNVESPWGERRLAHLRRMRELLPVLPAGAYFCGPSAALLWSIPLPPFLRPDLHVGVPRPRRAPRRPGVVSHQHSAGYVVVTERDGLPVTDPASTWATLGGMLGERDLVDAADFVLRIPRMPGGFRPVEDIALARREELYELAERKGRPGAPRLRSALELARTGSSSPPETRIRLLMRDAGLPEPELDHDVYDEHGVFLGCSELAYPGLRVAIE